MLAGRHRVEPTALFIHGAVHRLTGRAVVLHCHMPYATALTLTADRGLDPTLSQNAMRYMNRIAIDAEYNGLALDDAEGERIARTMMGDPELVLIDEPTEGLAPQLVDLVAGFLRALQERGVSVLLIEQKLTIALDLAHRCYVMGQGRIVFEGTPAELSARPDIRRDWLEV